MEQHARKAVAYRGRRTPQRRERVAATHTAGSQRSQADGDAAATYAHSQQAIEFEHGRLKGCNLVPIVRTAPADQLTPVLAYRCLVNAYDRAKPSFLLESVVGGERSSRFSYVGASPAIELVAKHKSVACIEHGASYGGTDSTVEHYMCDDPVAEISRLSANWQPYISSYLPECFSGGWVGFTGYDTARYGVYENKIPFEHAPPDDRGLPDMHLVLHTQVLVFDQAKKVVHAIRWANPANESFESALSAVDVMLAQLHPTVSPQLQFGSLDAGWDATCGANDRTSLGKRTVLPEQYMQSVKHAVSAVEEGEVFQAVLSQRFERSSFAEPFDVYRALRVVNPSPYMLYMQARGCTFVSASPEILCRVDRNHTVVNRPLAGTRARGQTMEEDIENEKTLLSDEKERAEHMMLVDLGRNDVGRVSAPGSVQVERLLEIERYSHVMHISSTVTGQLADGLTCWDALRAALPAGTISGAPKVRAMQLIDELESTRRGPYGGGIGAAGFTGDMDIALALRTIIVPTHADPCAEENMGRASLVAEPTGEDGAWEFHLQSGAGVVADSDPESEQLECENKAAALSRAIDLAELAFDPLEPRSATTGEGRM